MPEDCVVQCKFAGMWLTVGGRKATTMCAKIRLQPQDKGVTAAYPELLLHACHLLCAALQLIQAHCVPAQRLAVLYTLGSQQALEHGDQLQV